MLAPYNPRTPRTRIVRAAGALLATVGSFAPVLGLVVHYDDLFLQVAQQEALQEPDARQQQRLALAPRLELATEQAMPEPAVPQDQAPAPRASGLRVAQDAPRPGGHRAPAARPVGATQWLR